MKKIFVLSILLAFSTDLMAANSRPTFGEALKPASFDATPKPSYYENGVPVYVNTYEEQKKREAERKDKLNTANFPRFQGVKN